MNFMEQLSLFENSDDALLIVGSPEWRRFKYNELIKFTFEQLQELDDQINQRYYIKNDWFNATDYFTGLVLIDIFHSYYFDEFKKKYPKAMVYYELPFYL